METIEATLRSHFEKLMLEAVFEKCEKCIFYAKASEKDVKIKDSSPKPVT